MNAKTHLSGSLVQAEEPKDVVTQIGKLLMTRHEQLLYR